MRKVLGMALIALMVMLAASCDGILQNTDGDLVTLSINTDAAVGNSELAGNSRSLTGTLAKKEANYVEVIFSYGGEYYRTEGYAGSDLKIKLPGGTTTTPISYSSTNSIMLIGRKSDSTLLATGVPIAFTVPGTTTATFTVTSLTADIYAKSTTPSFAVTSSGYPAGWSDAATTVGVFGEDSASPSFQVPTGTALQASLAIGGLSATGSNIFVNSITGVVTFKQVAGTTAGITPTITAPASANVAIGTTGSIAFSFTSPATYGEYIIIFNIPVVGFDSAAATAALIPNRRTWHIRGGTNPGQPDFTGAAADDPNEGIPLVVTTSPNPLYGITITAPTITP